MVLHCLINQSSSFNEEKLITSFAMLTTKKKIVCTLRTAGSDHWRIAGLKKLATLPLDGTRSIFYLFLENDSWILLLF